LAELIIFTPLFNNLQSIQSLRNALYEIAGDAVLIGLDDNCIIADMISSPAG